MSIVPTVNPNICGGNLPVEVRGPHPVKTRSFFETFSKQGD